MRSSLPTAHMQESRRKICCLTARPEVHQLGDSSKQAEHRMNLLENRFQRQPQQI
jgi:hypothetical protein